MFLSLTKIVWDFLYNYGIDFATWITAVGIIATAWIAYYQTKKRLEISWESEKYVNEPEPLIEFYVTNVGSHLVAIKNRGLEKFDGTGYFADIYLRTDLEEYDTMNLGFYIDQNMKYGFNRKEFEEIYFIYVQDLAGEKYRTYPHGCLKAHVKRLWYLVSHN